MDVLTSKNLKINISQPAKAKPNVNVASGIGLLILCCGCFAWFLVLPKRSEVEAKQSQLQQVVSNQKQLDAQTQELKQLEDKLSANSNNVQILDQALPLNGKTFDLQIYLTNLAVSTGVNLASISLSNSSNQIVGGNTTLLQNPYGITRTLQKIDGNITVSGSFSQIQDFLDKLENSLRIIDVSSLSISAGQGSQLDLQVGITAYYFAPKS